MEQLTENNTKTLSAITAFLDAIGIPCKPANIDYDTFLPGADIKEGCILYDVKRLASPGDLLHEAGHIAVLNAQARANVTSPEISGDISAPAAEMAAIAWSWAALTHLQLSPEVVFHEKGYHGESRSIIDNFSQKRYFGVSMLQWLGMTVENRTKEDVAGTYPVLTNWLRPG